MSGRGQYSARTKARKAALDVLFAAELRGVAAVDVLLEQPEIGGTPNRELTTRIVHGVTEHQAAIDAKLEQLVSESRPLHRMPAVDRNLARMALYELDYTDTPGPAVIAEAVRLASDLSTDESPGFLNGLLAQALAASSQETD